MLNRSETENKRKSITILMVDDQPMIGEAVRQMLADDSDIDFNFCENPTKALAVANEVRPTVILQDLIMPDVDGLTLVKFFRANPKTKDVPIIVLSSKEDADIKYRAFEYGANDYIVKFPEKLEVLARIRYHSKAYTNLCERNMAMAELQASQNALKNELDEASKYVISLLPKKIDEDFLKTDWVFQSSTELGGDCFGYGWIDSQNFSMYLLDVCGHGVGAALLSVSAMNVLRSQSLAGVDFRNPEQVLSGLNSAFEMEKQNGMYFTLWYGVFNSSTKELTYASGGHPPAILVANSTYTPLSTPNIVIGGMQGVKFQKKSVQVPEKARLYIFSDGVYELDYADGSGMMSVQDFAAKLVESSHTNSKVCEMMDFCQSAQDDKNFEDDYSLCEITFK